ncbi:MAG: right-handed parallel beta-helix repeat-containing protein [Deltaproteobacteria bacterium]|jgi:hypothetical protein|nr:right-handed parallel beta-helix repeat-containing protein [Deltaproteobacteria bacterium]MBW2536881.1 right-handed parallel beta-helix repeat-containing protein [Deltaproteobacteria bacterium]
MPVHPRTLVAACAVLLPLAGCSSSEQRPTTETSPPAALTPPAEGAPVPATMACDEPTGTVHYVSPSGDDDAGDGSSASPWQTLAKAAAAAEPGDGVYLMDGTFHEPLLPPRSGAEGAYITYRADPAASSVVIDGAGLSELDYGLVELSGVSWIKLCGLTIRNSAEHGVSVRDTYESPAAHIGLLELTVEATEVAAIHVEDVSDVVIERNVTRESVSSGIGVWYSARVAVRDNEVVNARNDDSRGYNEWISIAGVEDFEVAHNELYMQDADFRGHSAIDVKESSYRGTVHHNYVHDFPEGGQIYLDAWEAGLDGSYSLAHVDVFANLLVDAKGITVGSEQGGTAEHIRIFNNVILRSVSSGVLLSDTGRGDGGNGPRRNIHIFNNTISDTRNHGTSGIYLLSTHIENVVIQNNVVSLPPDRVVGLITAGSDHAVGQITVDHNLVFGPTECSNDYPSCAELSGREGNVTTDPRFVDSAAGDLHLQADSPAIDAGIAIDGLVDDFDGTARPQGSAVDIGAYEG